MFGAAIGVVFGGAGYILLRSFCRAVSQKARVSPLLALANPAVLLLGAGLSAWLCPKELLWTGIGMAAVLIAGAAIEAVSAVCRARKEPDVPERAESVAGRVAQKEESPPPGAQAHRP